MATLQTRKKNPVQKWRFRVLIVRNRNVAGGGGLPLGGSSGPYPPPAPGGIVLGGGFRIEPDRSAVRWQFFRGWLGDKLS